MQPLHYVPRVQLVQQVLTVCDRRDLNRQTRVGGSAVSRLLVQLVPSDLLDIQVVTP